MFGDGFAQKQRITFPFLCFLPHRRGGEKATRRVTFKYFTMPYAESNEGRGRDMDGARSGTGRWGSTKNSVNSLIQPVLETLCISAYVIIRTHSKN